MSQEPKDILGFVVGLIAVGVIATWGMFQIVEHHENMMMASGYVWVEDVAGHWEHR